MLFRWLTKKSHLQLGKIRGKTKQRRKEAKGIFTARIPERFSSAVSTRKMLLQQNTPLSYPSLSYRQSLEASYFREGFF